MRKMTRVTEKSTRETKSQVMSSDGFYRGRGKGRGGGGCV